MDKIEAVVGALAEDQSRGSTLGPLMSRVVCGQMIRIRAADPFYFERKGLFRPERLKRISKITLRELLLDNVPELRQIRLGENVFLQPHGDFDVRLKFVLTQQ